MNDKFFYDQSDVKKFGSEMFWQGWAVGVATATVGLFGLYFFGVIPGAYL